MEKSIAPKPERVEYYYSKSKIRRHIALFIVVGAISVGGAFFDNVVVQVVSICIAVVVMIATAMVAAQLRKNGIQLLLDEHGLTDYRFDFSIPWAEMEAVWNGYVENQEFIFIRVDDARRFFKKPHSGRRRFQISFHSRFSPDEIQIVMQYLDADCMSLLNEITAWREYTLAKNM